MTLQALLRRIKKLPTTAAKRGVLELQGRRAGARYATRRYTSLLSVWPVGRDNAIRSLIFKDGLVIKAHSLPRIVRDSFCEGALATFKLISQ